MQSMFVSLLGLLASAALAGEAPDQAAFRALYRELMEINTTQSAGDTVQSADAMAARLLAAGFPAEDVTVLKPAPRKGNLIARLRGSGNRPPILLLAHMDVVEAKRDDWDFDPFKLQEVDGWFRGRGAIDDKAMAAIFTANLIRYRQEGFKPDRDLILALTADEEVGGGMGVQWLLANHRPLLDAAFAINEGGGGSLKDGKPHRLFVQLAEKVVANFRLEAKDSGGHSSIPKRENPIYRLAAALTRLGAYDFPPRLNPVTRGFFERIVEAEPSPAVRALLAGTQDPAKLKPLRERPLSNAQISTTCVATLLEGGHASNALPQTARATINCRVLPDEPVGEIEQRLRQVIDDPKLTLTLVASGALSPPSPLDPALMRTVEALTAEMWPGVVVLPIMSTGATDSRYLRNIGMPVYGVSGLFSDIGNNGIHGQNEQIRVQALYDGKEFLYRLVKRLSGAGA